MVATIHSKLTELRGKLGGLLKGSNELTNVRQPKSQEIEQPYKPMEQHKATFQVIEKETYISRYGTPREPPRPVWRYVVTLLDGPYTGRKLTEFRIKDLNEWEKGAKYAGEVYLKEVRDWGGREFSDAGRLPGQANKIYANKIRVEIGI